MKRINLSILTMTLMLSGVSQAGVTELCFGREYSSAHLAKPKNKKQVASAIYLKIRNEDDDKKPSLFDVINNKEAVINIKTRAGKTYVYDMGPLDCTIQGCSEASTEQGPDGFFSYSYNFVTSNLELKLRGEEGFSLREKNTFCNDGLECDDVLSFEESDAANTIYHLKEVPCSSVSIIKHSNGKPKKNR